MRLIDLMHSTLGKTYGCKETMPSFAYWTIVVLTFILFLCLCILQIQKNPLRYDEVDYFQCMENIWRLGVPLYYAGEVNIDPHRLLYLFTRRLGEQTFEFYRYKPETGILKETFFALVNGTSRYTYGMWHPPLYIYFGSLAFRLYPLSPGNGHSLRYFNLIFSIGVFAGMIALSRVLYPDRHRQVSLIALILYTLNSLAVRGSILIDYNATLGPCVAIWFALAYLSRKDQGLPWKLAIFTILALFTSLGIGLNLILGALAHIALTIRYRRPWQPIAALIVGTAGFFLTFLLFCRIFYLPFSQPFLHNFSRIGAQFTFSWLIQRINIAARYIQIYCKEIGLPATLTAVGLVLKNIVTRETSRVPDRGFLPLILIIGLMSHTSLGAEAYGFMKYILFLLPLLFVYLAGEASLLFSTSRSVKVFMVATFVLIALTSATDSLQMIHHQGGTLYDRETQGTVAIAQRLATISDPDEIILSDKDVAFFARRKFVQWSDTYSINVEALKTRIAEEGIRYIVIKSDILNAFPELNSYINSEFFLQDRMGSYVLLRSK